MNISSKHLLIALLSAMLALIGLAGCERDGPAERAGESIDNTAEKAGDNLEDAKDSMVDQVDRARD